MEKQRKIKIYTDESVSIAVAKGLRRRGIEAWSCAEMGNRGLLDEKQLDYAYENYFVMFTHDTDFAKLGAKYSLEGRNHCGVIYAHQRKYSIGECIQKLKYIVDNSSPKNMENHVEFL